MTYTEALKQYSKGTYTDEALMARFCKHDLRRMVRDVSPKLVWENAYAARFTADELVQLASHEPDAIRDLERELA